MDKEFENTCKDLGSGKHVLRFCDPSSPGRLVNKILVFPPVYHESCYCFAEERSTCPRLTMRVTVCTLLESVAFPLELFTSHHTQDTSILDDFPFQLSHMFGICPLRQREDGIIENNSNLSSICRNSHVTTGSED